VHELDERSSSLDIPRFDRLELQRERNGRERGGEGKEARELGKERTEKGKPNETIKHVTPNVSSCTGS